jgi:hypothetical protein
MAQRVQLVVDVLVQPGNNPKDMAEWVQTYFRYFHKSFDARVDMKNIAVTGERTKEQSETPAPIADDLI